MLCHERKETRFINLFVFGSEGLDICNECEMEVVESIREIRRNKAIKYLRDVMAKKENGQ